MAGLKKKVATRYVRACLKEDPDIGNRTIARILAKEEPALFPSVENARALVRSIVGQNPGGKTTPIEELVRESGDHRRGGKQFPIPKRVGLTDTSAYDIKGTKIGILSDVHIPYHDEAALQIALEYLYKEGIDALYLNGDIADMYSVSRWERDPRLRDFPGEMESVRDFLGMLAENFQNIVFKEGNHEERYERLIFSQMPDLVGLSEFDLAELLHLRKLGITHLDRMRHVRMGRLVGIHGHEYFGAASSVSPARTLYLRTKRSAFCGHHHQSSQHSEKDVEGNVVSCWSVGGLCDLTPRYMRYNRWNHGFAICELDPSDPKEFLFRNYRIINGRVV